MGKLFPSICHHQKRRPAEYLLQIDFLILSDILDNFLILSDILDNILILSDILDNILIPWDITDSMCYVLY